MPAPPRIAWSRPEPFGAWVRLDDATLIAVDHALADRLGVPRPEGSMASSRPSRPLELHIAVTSRCFAPCEGCYMDARPDGVEPPLEEILARLSAARDAGASTVALGGGEPLLRRDLGQIAGAARALGLVPVMTTSGLGLSAERAAELRAFAQINVSHDGALGGYRDVRGWSGQTAAERALEILRDAGIPAGANVVLTRATVDLLPATAERVASAGAREIQLLRYKPGGRAADPSYLDRRLLPEQVDRLWPAIQGIVAAGRLRVRIDCAMVPLLGSALLASVDRAAEALAALGVFGCEAARHLSGMRIDGTLAPCSFFSTQPGRASASALRRRALPLFEPEKERTARDAASGDLLLESPRGHRARSEEGSFRDGEELERFRAYHAALPEPCSSCELAPVCRGGCQVVSRHEAGGAFGPDPECPRVRAFHEDASASASAAAAAAAITATAAAAVTAAAATTAAAPLPS